ncbi:MAG TPA: family 2A encapsulin nanocompartment cargo protein cysteine desulfurase [Burkholderiaceae bacterium]
MQTPTSDLGDAGLAVPAGLPDVATLSRLANEFFASLPGSGVQPPAHPLPAGASFGPLANGPQLPGTLVPGGNVAPTSVQDLASIALAQPARAPKAQAGNGVPDVIYTAVPALDSRLGGAAIGVPSAYYFSEFALPLGGRDSEPPPFASRESDLPFAGRDGAPQSFAARDSEPLPHASASAHPPFDVHAVRRDFPILQERVNGRPLAWFDNAATTQKPQSVIDRLAHFYAHENSNIHRAAHELAARATDAYEGARKTVQRFIGASSDEEIIFVRGTTEGINLVAATWGEKHIAAGDEIIVSHLEHHANIVPWQMLAARKGAKLRVIPVDDSGQVILAEYQRLLNEKTKLVAVTQVSNALGTVVPVKEIVALAHRAGACALVDGAQSVSHMRVNVQEMGADFFVFSGHKIFGPTGIGAVYGRREILEDLPPYQGGGNMIQDVTFEKTVYHGPPTRFEAGTGNIADAVGLGAALEYVQRIGIENIGRYEHDLLAYATHHLQPIPGVRLIGTARDKASVLSFVLDGYTTDEVGQALNREGIAVRTGHHCAQPILRRFGLEATVRPSLAFYNTCEEVDRFIAVVQALAQRRR